MKKYKETNRCPICANGQYGYNETKISCQYEIFYVGNDTISFAMKVNYCPVCGKYIGKED